MVGITNTNRMVDIASQALDASIMTLKKARKDNFEIFNFEAEYILCDTINLIEEHKQKILSLKNKEK